MFASSAAKVYDDGSNGPLLSLVPMQAGRALDCGCGAGANARRLAAAGWQVTGITISPSEKESAAATCHQVVLADLELGVPTSVEGRFDLVILSHVIEHLSRPDLFLRALRPLLTDSGMVALAIPNISHIRYRLRMLGGHFDYEPRGALDETHLRFFTVDSARRLIEGAGYRVVRSTADGHLSLGPTRRLLPGPLAACLDTWAVDRWPGLFALQLLYLLAPH